MFRIQANICYHSTLQTMKHCLHLHRKMYSHFIKNNYYFTAASDMMWPVMPKTSLALGFNFCNINQNLKNQYFHPFRHLSGPIRKQEVIVCDLQMVDFNPFCVFLCFKVCCFWTSGLSRMFLKSTVIITLALSFIVFFILKHGKFRLPEETQSIRAGSWPKHTAS